jgi:rSAM/selenodomain-associated transferase 2
MTAREFLHRSLCVVFVLVTGAVYLVEAAPAGTHGAYGIAQHAVLALVMFGAFATSRAGTARDHRWTLLAGAAARVLAVPVAVSSSHDVQRYLWDGAVFWSGLDPYSLAPASSQLTALRAMWPTPLEHVAYKTLYPPGAVFLFGAASSFGPALAPWVWKLFIAAASLGTLWLGSRALKEMGLSRHLPLLAFSPLLVSETATGAHLDVICGLAVAGGLFFVARGSATFAGLALGAGALVKFLPALALLPLVSHFRGRSARRLVASAAGIIGAGYGVALVLGLRPLGSLPVFFEKWRFGSPVFSALAAVLGDAPTLRLFPFLLGAALIAIARLPRSAWRSAVPLALAAPLFVSPVVFPWYLAPIVPAIAMAPSTFALAWVTALPLTNEVIGRWQAEGVWEPASWPLWAIGISWIAGIAIDLGRRRSGPDCSVSSPKPAPRVTVIVPVLNEEARIGEQLDALRAVPELHEVLVVDGGSTDQSPAIVRERSGVKLLVAPRGRAAQMNAGAALATGEVLLFLHADVRLPQDAARWIATALEDPSVVGGAFRTWTVGEGKRAWLAPLLHLADLRSRYSRLPYGDQALFVRTEVFKRLGGFPDQPVMEDLELSRRLSRVGRLRTVPAVVRVSGRRFVARPAYYALLVNVSPLLYRLGMPPRVLASLYGEPR